MKTHGYYAHFYFLTRVLICLHLFNLNKLINLRIIFKARRLNSHRMKQAYGYFP